MPIFLDFPVKPLRPVGGKGGEESEKSGVRGCDAGLYFLEGLISEKAYSLKLKTLE
jgi:hypothetical protein